MRTSQKRQNILGRNLCLKLHSKLEGSNGNVIKKSVINTHGVIIIVMPVKPVSMLHIYQSS